MKFSGMLTFIIFFRLNLFASEIPLEHLKDWVKKKLQKNDENSIYYPISEWAQAISLPNHQKIKRLEEILTMKEFEGDHQTLELGPSLGMNLWRDLIYLSLSSAHFKAKDYVSAYYYSSKILPSSELFHHQLVISGFSQLATQDKNRVAVLKEILAQAPKNNSPYEGEWEILKIAYQTMIHDFNYSPNISFKNKLSNEYRDTFNLYLGNFYYLKYLSEFESRDFNTNRKEMQRVMNIFGEVSKSVIARTPKQAFLSSEANWMFASLHRIEDAQKYQSEIAGALQRGKDYLLPWIKKGVLGEEGEFLAAVIDVDLKNKDAFISQLKYIARKYPYGQYLTDTHQLLADEFFESKNFVEAIKYYAKLSSSSNIEKATYGVYKAAWSYYNLGNGKLAFSHLHQLMNFMEKLLANDRKIEQDNLSLYKEVRSDYISVAAEFLSYREILNQVASLPLSEAKIQELFTTIGENLKRIGRYQDAIGLMKTLLAKYMNGEKSIHTTSWLITLLTSHFAAGNRLMIPVEVSTFMPLFLKNHTNASPEFVQLEKALVDLTLMVHREAKKSLDSDIATATDQLYLVFHQYFPDAPHPQLWYFGAQRLETKGNLLSAVEWYQKVAKFPANEFSEDAQLSVLRLVKKESDRISLYKKNEIPNNEKEKIIKLQLQIQTFLQHHIHHPEKSGTLGLLQTLYEQEDNPQEVVGKFVAFVHSHPEPQQLFPLSKALVAYFYRLSDYHLAYSLASSMEKLGQFEIKYFREIRQESAVLAARKLPKSDQSEKISYYQRSLDIAIDKKWYLQGLFELVSEVAKLPQLSEQNELLDYLERNFQKNINQFALSKDEVEIIVSYFQKRVEFNFSKGDFKTCHREMSHLIGFELKANSKLSDVGMWNTAFSCAILSGESDWVKKLLFDEKYMVRLTPLQKLWVSQLLIYANNQELSGNYLAQVLTSLFPNTKDSSDFSKEQLVALQAFGKWVFTFGQQEDSYFKSVLNTINRVPPFSIPELATYHAIKYRNQYDLYSEFKNDLKGDDFKNYFAGYLKAKNTLSKILKTDHPLDQYFATCTFSQVVGDVLAHNAFSSQVKESYSQETLTKIMNQHHLMTKEKGAMENECQNLRKGGVGLLAQLSDTSKRRLISFNPSAELSSETDQKKKYLAYAEKGQFLLASVMHPEWMQSSEGLLAESNYQQHHFRSYQLLSSHSYAAGFSLANTVRDALLLKGVVISSPKPEEKTSINRIPANQSRGKKTKR